MTIRVPRLSSSDSSHERPGMAETVYLMLEGWLEVTGPGAMVTLDALDSVRPPAGTGGRMGNASASPATMLVAMSTVAQA